MGKTPHSELNRGIQVFFDGCAARWDADRPPESVERLGALVAELAIRPGSRILDVGTGTGVVLPALAPSLGEEGLIVALDLSWEMLRQAKARGGSHRIVCLQADVMDLPIASAFFDWIICYSVFPHFSNQHRGLAELSRTLKPGCRLVICHSQSREAINALHRSVGDVVGGHTLPDDPHMKALISEAGLHLTHLENRPDRYLVIAQKPA